jgi:YD repeat-containing protein
MNMSSSTYGGAAASAAPSAAALLWPLALCLILSSASVVARAQNSSDRGTPAESKPGQSSASTYARDKVETVNLANGNLTLSIPLATIGGRGSASYAVALTYNSKVWTAQHDREAIFTQGGAQGTPVEHYSAMYDKLVDDEPYLARLGGGWTILKAPGLKGKFVGIDPLTSGCNNFTDGARDCGSKYVLTKMWLTLPDGSQVELRDTATDGAPALTPTNGDGYHPLTDRDRGRVWHSFDGSGVTFVRDANDPVVGAWPNTFLPGGWVFLADGTRLRVDAGVCSKIMDADGNYITIGAGADGTTVYTDELGRQTTLQFAGGTATVTAKGYMGAADRSLTVNTGLVGDNLRTDFRSLPRPFTTGDALHDQFGNYYEHTIAGPHTDLFLDSEGVIAYNDPGGEDVGAQTAVTRLNLLDGRSFLFRYNQYGEVAEVVYPGGGVSQVDYRGYTTTVCEVRASLGLTLNRRVSERRTLTDGSSVDAAWVYTRGFTAVGGTSYPSVSVEAHQGGNTGAVLSSENHIFYALDAEYRPCGGSFTGTGNEYWTNAKEFRTETQTGTGTVTTVRNWEQRATVSWANDVGSNVNAYAQQHGVDVLAANDPRVTWEETTLEDGKTKRVEYAYDQFDNVTSTKEYDFRAAGAQPPGTLLRQTVRTYAGDGAAPALNGYCYTNLDPLDSSCGGGLASDVTSIVHQKRLLLSEQVLDGAGNQEAYANREYDNYRGPDWNASPPDTNAGMTMYDGARFNAFDPTLQPRGNVTAARAWVEGVTYAVSYTRYDNAGSVVSRKDPRGFVSNVSYADDFGDGANPGGGAAGPNGATFAFPTAATNALGQQSRTQYDYTLGAAAGVRDANGVVTRTEYDAAGRPVRTTAALGLAEQAAAEVSYPTAAANVMKVSRQLDAARWLASKTEMDGFGRPVLEATAEDGQKADVASFTLFTKTVYDALGRVRLVTNPYRTQSASTDGWTRTVYDLAGRVTEVASFAGGVSTPPPDAGTSADWTGSVVTTYSGEQTTVRDQANKQRRSTVDALGRLLSVDEMYEYPSASVYATTDYDYDARGNLRTVRQGEQTRSFTYDGLSRLRSATNPEVCQQQPTGCAPVPVTYEYDLGGNLKKKLDSRGIIVQYVYDALNRVVSRFYTGEAGPPTPSVTYTYDDPSVANSKGRLTSVSSSVSSYGYTSYDAVGRVRATSQATDGVTYSVAYQYDLAGDLTSERYPSGRVISTEYDGAGRAAGVRNQASGLYYAGGAAADPAGRIQYAAHGAASSVRLGSGLWEHTLFNSRLQPTQIGLGLSTLDSSALRLDYAYGTADDDGDVRAQTITTPGSASPFVQTYSYDQSNRLESAEETIGGVSNWRQVYSYDRYGNRSLAAGTTLPAQLDAGNNPTVSTSNNRIASAGYTYDPAGNLLCDPSHPCSQAPGFTPYYAYDAENRMTAAGGSSYFYDGDGRRVKKAVGGVTTVFVYDAAGRLAAEYGGAQPQAGGTSYITQDSLGSTRVVTGQDQGVRGRYDYLPFGEEAYAGRVGYGGEDIRQRFTLSPTPGRSECAVTSTTSTSTTSRSLRFRQYCPCL